MNLWIKIKKLWNKAGKWISKKENKWILAGGAIAVIALATPFTVLYKIKGKTTLESFQTFGVIGDFFGGTTVGLLSLASIILVIAAIVMQKEELALQRDEVRQTKEEYKITNQTMKKQQFETTFFNLIHLHHNLLKDIKRKDNNGREVIKKAHSELEGIYKFETYRQYKKAFIKKVMKENILEIQGLARQIYIDEGIRQVLERRNIKKWRKTYKTGPFAGEMEWDSIERQGSGSAFDLLPERERNYEEIINDIDVRMYTEKEIPMFHHLIKSFVNDFREEPTHLWKSKAYEELYEKYEDTFGHYYRNLYRIIKLVQETEFSHETEPLKKQKEDEVERKKYIGILRAQLSSFELLMLFYNVVYSEKGGKFKDILKGTNFFDDHLIKEAFIWKNDIEELRNWGLSDHNYK